MISAVLEKKWAFPGFCLLLAFLIVTKSVIVGEFGQIGPDSDDVMRLTQIRDFLTGGQSWFETDQSRMGPAGGTDMHWSRLVDIPIILLIGFFNLFLPYASAEAIAISIWPPMSATLVLVGVYTGAKFLKDRKAAWIAAILAGFYLLTHYRFASGAIDHHNVQFGLICMAAGFALDTAYRARSFAISGICLALSVAIGTEVYIFATVICLYVAALWLFNGLPVSRAVSTFGLSLMAALIVIFIAVTAPSDYGRLYCDALSWITVAAGGLGGLGLAVLARTLSGKTFSIRLFGLLGLGIACAGLLLLSAPQCLSNPLSDLPLDVKTLWLDNIVEARPLFDKPEDYFLTVPLGVGVAVLGFGLAMLKIKNNTKTPQYALLAGLLLSGTLLSLYQLRFVGFGQFLAFIITGVWVYELLSKRNDKGERSLAYIGAIALSVPMFWALPAVLLGQAETPDTGVASGDAALCYSDNVIDFMKTLPPGQVLATDNGTPILLTQTEHRVLGGNYHRNVEGIQMAIRAYTSSLKDAEQYLTDGAVDYVHVCRTTQETVILRDQNSDGLMAALFDENTPPILTPIKTLEDGAVTIYRFTP